jgi:hypothetical protein
MILGAPFEWRLVGAIFTGHRIPWCCLWWLAWLPSSLIPILKTDIYNHTSLCLVSPYNVSDTPILPFKNPTIFRVVLSITVRNQYTGPNGTPLEVVR